MNPAEKLLAEVVLDRMDARQRAAFYRSRTPGELAVLEDAVADRTDPQGMRIYRAVGYEPICIPRVRAALAAGHRTPLDAEAAGIELPAMCGGCPAERYDASTEFDVLFGGAAGGSKTKSTIMFGIRCMVRWPGFRALLLRETYDELDENVYPELRAIDYAADVGGSWNAGRRQLDIGTSAMRFRYMHDLDDIRRRRGGNYQLVMFDERNQLPPGTADALRDRLRSADPNIPVIGFRSTANPGGRSHGELKQQYVKPDPRTHDTKVDRHGDRVTVVRSATGATYHRKYIPARATDNPYLGDDYYETVLGSIEDPVLRAAMRDGDWDKFSGQFFGEWSDDRHLVPRTAVELADGWRRYAGIDYGRAAPWCVLRGALDGDGRLWLYREMYKTGLGEREQAKLIVEDERRCGDRDTRRGGDPSMWAKVSDANPISDTYSAAGAPMEKANNDRKSGWARVHTYLSDAEPCRWHAAAGLDACPLLHVLEDTCPNLVRTLPDLPFSRSNPEDLDTDAEDHAADALRYLVMMLPVPRRRRPKLVAPDGRPATAGQLQRASTA